MVRILLAEDEIVLGNLVKDALEREPDFTLDIGNRRQSRLGRFLARPVQPDICVLDVMMPWRWMAITRFRQ